MTIYEYVAYKNPLGAKKVIESFGGKAIKQPEILSKQLADTVNRNGKEALYRIASVHPDAELMKNYIEFNLEKAKKDEKKEEKCDCKNESIFLSAEGQQIKSTVEELKRSQSSAGQNTNTRSEKTELLIIGAIAIVGLALVLKY